MDPSRLVEWVKLGPRQWLVVALATGSVALAPMELARRVGLDGLALGYRGWFGAAFVLSSAALVAHGLASLGQAILSRRRRDRDLYFRRQTLHELSPEERDILRRFMVRNTKTVSLDVSRGVHAELEANRVISRATTVSRYLMHFDYNLQPWARRYLLEHPELLA